MAIQVLEGDTPKLAEARDILINLEDKVKSRLSSFLMERTEEELGFAIQLAANLLDPVRRDEHLSEDEMPDAIEGIIEIAKNIPNLNEVSVMTDITEYRNKDKLWSRDLIWIAAQNMSPLTWRKGYCNA